MKRKGKKTKIKKTKSAHESFKKVSEEKILGRAKELLEPMCEAEGMELIHIEYQREAGGRILRLYIDRPGGVTLDDCVGVSRQSGDLLDVYLDDIGHYRLEVSSPGANRPLGKKIDYERFKGNRVKIVTAQPIKGQKNFKGILLGITDGKVSLSIDDKTVTIPHEEIARAYLTTRIRP